MSVANNLTGKTLSNRYEILRPLGEGGMGKVYLAKDKRFGKQVVVKVPTMEAGDKNFKDRFMREIASLATLEHPHIVTTVDWGEIEGIPFLVLRYLGGGSLRDRITDSQGFYKPMPLEGLNQWLPQIASALDFIHTKNWVHRDLKPDNILFDEAGNPYLADFGIAKALEGAPMGVKTIMGASIGTPQYMAPEMHLGKGIGPRADQFGLAVLVYEALAGKIPFNGITPTAIFVEVIQGKATPIHELVPGIPLEKSNALMKGITKEPRDRYGSCVEFANAVMGSVLARGSFLVSNETPSKPEIAGTRIETLLPIPLAVPVSIPLEIPGTRIETPSKPEIAGTRIETPPLIPLADPMSIPLKILGTRIDDPSNPNNEGTSKDTPPHIPLEITDSIMEEVPEQLNNAEETETQSDPEEFNSDSNLYPDLALTPEDYLTENGQMLAQLCRDLIEKEKVSKGWWIKASRFFKKHDVSQILGGKALLEKMEEINKLGRVSREISDDVVQLAIRILKEKNPLVENEIANLINNELAEEQIIGKVLKNPPSKILLLPRISFGQSSVIVFVILLSLLFLIFGRNFNSQQGEEKNNPATEKLPPTEEQEKNQEEKAKQMELAKFAAIEKEVVFIPAGKFLMGSPASEVDRVDNETQHEVTITKPFYMGKYEVTQEQWESVMGNNPSSRTKGAKLPVTDVSWNDCQEFIKKLNAKTSGGYRLPTEAEWEYACRAGTSTAYSFGNSLTKSDAHFGGDSIKIVGSYNPNAFGLYDMHGNVWEWCEDWKEDYPAGSVMDPKGPKTGLRRVLRGGSFFLSDSGSRSSYRGSFNTPSDRDSDLGFRLARTADIKAGASPTEPKPDPAAVIPATDNVLVSPFNEAKAKEVQKSVAKILQKEVEEKEELDKGIKLNLILIPAGKFNMGGLGDIREVAITKPYFVGKHEVTQEQWEAIMGNNPSSGTKEAKSPVTDVSWEDCQEFIKKLNARTNGGYRLPTEAEWEYACRAGTITEFAFGDRITKGDANYGDGVAGSTKAVGSYKPNAFGLYDMHGNVWEWCEDWYAAYPEGLVTDPKGPATGVGRVLRGGSFLFDESEVRSSLRFNRMPTNRVKYLGFRLARTADIKTTLVLKPDPAEIIPATVKLLVAPFNEAKAKEIQKEVAKILQKEVEEKEDLGNETKLEMVLIPAGKFKMGFTKRELEELKTAIKEDIKEDIKKELGKAELNLVDFITNIQGGQHEVTLTKPYYIGKYEVTQEQWKVLMGNNPSEIKGAKLPVTNISWEDCQEFIKKLNGKTNGDYRLPTEAEWEFACRAGTTTTTSFGDKISPKDANFKDSKIGKPVAVGNYKPNGFGLYDMHGNVSEWCEDWHGGYPEGAVTDPKGPATEQVREVRGGSFDVHGPSAYSSVRNFLPPNFRVIDFGFRLVRTAEIKAAVELTVPKPDPATVMPATVNLLVAPFSEAKAKEAQKATAKILQKGVEEKEDLGKGIKLEMVLIPAGNFVMGSPESESGRNNEEFQHEVTITKPYYIGKYKVTQEQWQAVMGNNPSLVKGAKFPVTNVSWTVCQTFIKNLNAKTNSGYRLPTEAEWEYACRAGTRTKYSFGQKGTLTDANYDGEPMEVGSYRQNAFGLHDMQGNDVWEWCEDWYGTYPAVAVTDPKGPLMGTGRVLRGRSSAYRISYSSPTIRNGSYGFRLVRTIDIKPITQPSLNKLGPVEVMPAKENRLVVPFTETKAKEVQKKVAESLQREIQKIDDLGKSVKLEMVLIPVGYFMMGSERGKGIGDIDETQHEVTLTKPYYMGKYEVTQEQWEVVMGNNPSKEKGPMLPVTDVSWEDCQEFIKKLNAKTDGGYRLPTEAEWEYACRAGTMTAYSFGETITLKDANGYGYSKIGKPVEVGSYKPNAFGLYDMHGNVREWCEDWYGTYPAGAVTNPKGPGIGAYRMLRGGSFEFPRTSSSCRDRDYDYIAPSRLRGNTGFRLAKSLDVKNVAAPTVPMQDSAEVIPTTCRMLVAPFTETKAKEIQKEVAKSLQKEVEETEDLGKEIKLNLVLIPAGKFMMGSPASEKGRRDNETQH